MGIIVPILLLIASYLLGSIPTALIVGKVFKGIDIREYGSKNMGTTNTLRVLGPKYSVVVFIGDALKASIIVLLFSTGLLNYESNWMIIKIHPLIYGIVAVIGHAFPIFADFKGGKGVACCAGIALSYCPLIFLIAISAFGVTLLITRYVSLSSIIGVGTAFICSWIPFLRFETKLDWWFIILVFIIWIFIIISHRKNIVKLFKGTESKIKFKKNKKAE